MTQRFLNILFYPRTIFAATANSLALVLATFLFGILLFRTATLEINDLIDPTESRYASIAQEMMLQNDWITPQLPMPTGMEPYLGKPPLHFWMTAISYSLFGMDEWTSRLPSLFGAVMIIALLIIYSRKFLSLEIGLVGSGILISSAIFYFFSGASVVDVTLSASVTLAVIGFAFGIGKCGTERYFYGALVGVGAALGFLTKGPVAIALLVVTFLGFALLRKDSRPIRDYPWMIGILVFILIVSPWFIWSEIRNPGLIKYFIWNENIGRYFLKDYGDLYGSGHRHIRGFVWVMLFLALLPWTPLLCYLGWKQRASFCSESRALLLAWGLSSVVFFTFVRQLHIGYILPSLPPLSLLLADLASRKISTADTSQRFVKSYVRIATIVGLVLSMMMLAWILFSTDTQDLLQDEMPLVALSLSAFILFILWQRTKKLQKDHPMVMRLQGAAAALSLMYGLTLVAITPQLDLGTSTASIIRTMSDTIAEDNPEIGIITRNTFSHYWIAQAGKAELSRPVRILFLEPNDVARVRHVLVKEKDFERLPTGVLGTYVERLKVGQWVWLERPLV